MGRKPCCDKVGLKKGSWSEEEDSRLIDFILTNGQCCWRDVPKLAGLLRCGKSCRLRWTNYLRPDLKRGLLSEAEEEIVIDLHAQIGNRWSKIASHLPGRTDNEIKNHWNTHIKKKLRKMGIDPLTHEPLIVQPAHGHDQQRQAGNADKKRKSEKSKQAELADQTGAVISEHSTDFGTEEMEVPIIDTRDALTVASASVSSTPSSVPCNSPAGGQSILQCEQTQIPCMDWPEPTCMWETDCFGGWDLVTDESYGKLDVDPFGQCQITVFDQDLWKFEFF